MLPDMVHNWWIYKEMLDVLETYERGRIPLGKLANIDGVVIHLNVSEARRDLFLRQCMDLEITYACALDRTPRDKPVVLTERDKQDVEHIVSTLKKMVQFSLNQLPSDEEILEIVIRGRS